VTRRDEKARAERKRDSKRDRQTEARQIERQNTEMQT